MSIKERPFMELVKSAFEKRAKFFEHNAELLDIYEGNLLHHLGLALKEQLSAQSYEEAMHRAAPINVLTKIVEKLSTLYNQAPVRQVLEGTDQDQVLVDWYVEKMRFNQIMSDALDLYNLSKSCLIQPFINPKTRTPGLRAIPNDRFFVLGLNPLDPMEVTHLVLFEVQNDGSAIFHVWSDDEVATFTSGFEVKVYEDNPDGINTWGKIPFIYANASRHLITPTPDSDTLRMTKLVPTLLTDLNYAAMYQSFSMIYTVDLTDENVKFAPNAVVKLMSDPTSDKKPEIGQIKPQVDFNEILSLISTQLSMWMDARGIRAGAIGKPDAEDSASGVAKMIDEADTTDYRRKLAEYFGDIEGELWNLIMHHAHPYWASQNLIDQRAAFTPTAQVVTSFTRQEPSKSRIEEVEETKAELEAGLTSKFRALKKLNPDFSDEQIEDLMLEIDPAAQAQSLNGAQVTSMQGVLEATARGDLPKETAKAMIKIAFSITDEQVNAMIDPIVPGSLASNEVDSGRATESDDPDTGRPEA